MAARDTVLVVEDDPDLAAVLVDTLADEGYRAIAAESVDEAHRLLRAFRVQLVLTDALWQDRAADPWAAVDALRALDGDAPIILCSGHDTSRFADYAAHGCAAFLPKPFELEALTALVTRLLPIRPVACAQSRGHALEQVV